jgi:hypothetical protein
MYDMYSNIWVDKFTLYTLQMSEVRVDIQWGATVDIRWGQSGYTVGATLEMQWGQSWYTVGGYSEATSIDYMALPASSQSSLGVLSHTSRPYHWILHSTLYILTKSKCSEIGTFQRTHRRNQLWCIEDLYSFLHARHRRGKRLRLRV